MLLGAGLLAKKAVERGLRAKPWVKTSLAPGSKVVTDYLKRRASCPTSRRSASTWWATAAPPASATRARCRSTSPSAVDEGDLVVAAVLSGNRNFEGRINPHGAMNYLASPPLVVAYALAGHDGHRPDNEPLATDRNGKPVFLKDIWPIARGDPRGRSRSSVKPEQFRNQYAHAFEGDELWQKLPVADGQHRSSGTRSRTYVRKPPFFENLPEGAGAPIRTSRARACWRCWATR